MIARQPRPRYAIEEDLRAAISNAEAAERQFDHQRDRLRGMEPGAPGREDVRYAMVKADAEAKHFRRCVQEYRAELGALPPAQQALPVPPPPQRLPYRDDDDPDEERSPPAEDPAMVRELGADDDDETPVWTPEAVAP